MGKTCLETCDNYCCSDSSTCWDFPFTGAPWPGDVNPGCETNGWLVVFGGNPLLLGFPGEIQNDKPVAPHSLGPESEKTRHVPLGCSQGLTNQLNPARAMRPPRPRGESRPPQAPPPRPLQHLASVAWARPFSSSGPLKWRNGCPFGVPLNHQKRGHHPKTTNPIGLETQAVGFQF